MLSRPMTGFIAAPFTPMRDDCSIELELLPLYATHLKVSGVSGVFVNGTTGEGYSLTMDERMQMAEAWVAEARGEMLVVVHVGSESLAEAQELASHAQAIGAHAVATMAPVFFKPDLDGLLAWCERIANSAPKVPFYFYHMPSMTGWTFPVVDLLELVSSRVPSFRGVKYTHGDLMDFGLCEEFAGGRFDILFGRDEILVSALAIGAQGMIGSTYNYAMPLFTALVKEFRAGHLEVAAAIQLRVMHLMRILHRYGGPLVAGKAVMQGLGICMGPTRVPNRSVTSNEADAMIDLLRAEGLLGSDTIAYGG